MKMKDSGVEWIGEIPESWGITRLKNALWERKENNNPVKTENILSLMKDIGVIPYEEKGDIGNKAKEDITSYKVAYPGDIVLNSMNIIIGSVGISQYFGAVSPVYYMLNVRRKDFDIRYFNYIFQSAVFQKFLIGYGNGILSHRMRIPMINLNSVMLPIPCSREQAIIAHFLDDKVSKIDAIIADTKESIEALKAYKQSVITETVTKGLNPDAPMKDSGVEWIGENPDHWETVKIKFLAEVKNGKEIPTESGNIPVYGSGGIFKTTDRPIYSKKSVLFGRKGTIGKPLFVEQQFWTVDTMYYTEINELKCLPEYFYYICQALPWELFTTQTAIPSIVGTTISNIITVLPCLDEQRKIVSYLSKRSKMIDGLIAGKEQLITEYESYKKSLIYEYVTGKKRIGGEESAG